MEEEEQEEQQEGGVNPEANPNSLGDPKKTSNEATLNGAAEGQASREEEEIDENQLRLDAELMTPALHAFHHAREERDMRKDLLNQKKGAKKSKDSKSTDKARDASREKKKDRLYWASMTKILTDSKLSVWKALDNSLGEYY